MAVEAITSDVLPLQLNTLRARINDARSGARHTSSYSGGDVLEVAETLARKIKSCVDALTFCIDGTPESDPFIVKLRATRDGAQRTLDALAKAKGGAS